MNTYLNPLARFLVALIFILSGVGKLFGFTETAAMMEGVGFPAPTFFLIGAILLEIVGGVLLLVGYRARGASLALMVFLVPATLIKLAPDETILSGDAPASFPASAVA